MFTATAFCPYSGFRKETALVIRVGTLVEKEAITEAN